MTGLRSWLEGRRPAAPEDLRLRVEEAVTEALRPESTEVHHGVAPAGGTAAAGPSHELPGASSPEARVEHLLKAAKQSLAVAAARPGRVRETAFELLVADALVTYACEAALETERPSEALQRIVEVGRTR